MPIYEYKCLDCGKIIETMRSISQADAPLVCLGCGSDNSTRLLSKCYSKNNSGGHNSSSNSCANCHSHSCSNCH